MLIPYPKGASRGDQILNAESFRKRGLQPRDDAGNLTPQALADAAIELYHDRGALYDAMSADAAETNGVDGCSNRFTNTPNRFALPLRSRRGGSFANAQARGMAMRLLIAEDERATADTLAGGCARSTTPWTSATTATRRGIT